MSHKYNRLKFLFYILLVAMATASCITWEKIQHVTSENTIQQTKQLLATNQFNSAREHLNQAIAIQPDNVELYVLRGQANLALYEWQLALEDYNIAIELEPSYAPAYFFRGILYYSILQTGLKTRGQALTDFEHYLLIAHNGEYADLATTYIMTLRSADDALNNGN